jgi:hypothetical protein
MNRVGSPESRHSGGFVVRRFDSPLAHAHHTVRAEHPEALRLFDEQEVPHVVPQGVDRLSELGQVTHRVVIGDMTRITTIGTNPVTGQGC